MVSIIVPVYNTDKYLRRCIESIQGQTIQNMEVILVDDGSQDSSGKICDEYAQMDNRIKVVHKRNEGLVSARKTGIRLAKGSYVGFVDSDDWIEKEMFDNMYQQAQAEEADIVAEGYLEDVYGICQCRKNVLSAGIYRSREKRDFFYKNMLSCEEYFCLGVQPFLWNKLMCRKLAEKYILSVENSIRIGEDAAVIYPAFLEAEKILILNECHYHYCLRNESMTWRLDVEEKELAEILILHSYLESVFGGKKETFLLQQQLKRYTMNNIMVRTFGFLAKKCGANKMFLSEEITTDESIIIYGAGALGRAIYQYMNNENRADIKAWVDQNAEVYQKMGLPVIIPEKIQFSKRDKVLIAVLRKKTVEEIRKKLITLGINRRQVVEVAFKSIEDINWQELLNRKNLTNESDFI